MIETVVIWMLISIGGNHEMKVVEKFNTSAACTYVLNQVRYMDKKALIECVRKNPN